MKNGSPRRPRENSSGWAVYATVVMVIIALLWIPVVKGAHGLYDYLQSVQGYLAPPIFVVFFSECSGST